LTSNEQSVEPGAHLLPDDVGLRMVRPSRIDQSRYLLVTGKRGRDRAGGVGLSLHPHRQGLEAFEQDPRIEWRQRRTGLPQDLMVVVEDQLL
jgi:hypothetical protein